MKQPSDSDLPGADSLLAWFGRWPTFHDAEVLALNLERDGVSSLKVHAWLLTNETVKQDGKVFFQTDKHAVVTFQLEGIVDLELADFSVQNVIAGLEVERKGEFVRLKLWPCFGIGGHIDAQKVSVTFHPGAPDA